MRASTKCMTHLLCVLIFAIEWHYCESCSPCPLSTFSRPNISNVSISLTVRALPTWLLKDYATLLGPYSQHVINISLSMGHFPYTKSCHHSSRNLISTTQPIKLQNYVQHAVFTKDPEARRSQDDRILITKQSVPGVPVCSPLSSFNRICCAQGIFRYCWCLR